MQRLSIYGELGCHICMSKRSISIYMITSVPCRAVSSVRLSVAGCPGVRRGIPVDLVRHNGRARVHRRSGQRRSDKSPRTKNSRGPGSRVRGGATSLHEQRTAAVRALGRGDCNWVAIKLCLNNRARSRRQANSSGERLGGYRYTLAGPGLGN